MSMLFFKYENEKPNISSHLGGHSFITKDDKWPTCHKCDKNMTFFMQLREITKDGNVVLKVFYNCRCEIENYQPIINVIEYDNPRMDQSILVDKDITISPFVDIRLDPSWSIPSWSLLPFYNPIIHKEILSMHHNDTDLAEDYYEARRWNENYLATEPYSLINGYPEFISDPKLFKCHCCNKNTDFVFQLDTDDEFQIDWNGGILYCYQCPQTKTLYFTIN